MSRCAWKVIATHSHPRDFRTRIKRPAKNHIQFIELKNFPDRLLVAGPLTLDLFRAAKNLSVAPTATPHELASRLFARPQSGRVRTPRFVRSTLPPTPFAALLRPRERKKGANSRAPAVFNHPRALPQGHCHFGPALAGSMVGRHRHLEIFGAGHVLDDAVRRSSSRRGTRSESASSSRPPHASSASRRLAPSKNITRREVAWNFPKRGYIGTIVTTSILSGLHYTQPQACYS